MDSHEEKYMARCLQLSNLAAGHVAPNPMVGAVLVYQDRIIGEGYHQQYGKAHAEVNCINSVKEIDKHLIASSTIYVSLEPCAHFGKTPPCADLIIKNKIPKVVIGCRDPFTAVDGKGIEKLKNAGIEVEMSRMRNDCIFLNRRFFTFHICKRPYIILKWAQTADNFIAAAQDSNRLLISNNIVNRLVHRWRSEEASILVGTQTAILDNPSLSNRLWTGKNPLRMVIDRKESIPETHHILDNTIPTIVFSESDISHKNKENIQYKAIPESQNSIDFILNYCYENTVQSILVEGGSKLHQSFIDKGLWDEIRIITNEDLYIGNGLPAPKISHVSTIDSQTRIDRNTIDIIYNKQEKIY